MRPKQKAAKPASGKNRAAIPADPMEQAKARIQGKAKALGLEPPDPVKVNGDLLKAEADAEAAARIKEARKVSRLLNDTLIGTPSAKSAGTAKKGGTAKKSTIKQLIIGMLAANPNATNDEMIGAVKVDFPSSAFDKRHAAWYRSQARTGKLSGTPMTGRK